VRDTEVSVMLLLLASTTHYQPKGYGTWVWCKKLKEVIQNITSHLETIQPQNVARKVCVKNSWPSLKHPVLTIFIN